MTFRNQETQILAMPTVGARGRAFENIVQIYLLTDPAMRFQTVCRWRDWPDRESLGSPATDLGIDLVGVDAAGGLVGVQTKFVSDPSRRTSYGDLATFALLVTSSPQGQVRPFDRGLLVTNADGTTSNVQNLIVNGRNIDLILRDGLESSPIYWGTIAPAQTAAYARFAGDTYRQQLRIRSHDQYGYITTRDARDLGVPAVALRAMARGGGIDRIGHGVYKFNDFPDKPHSQSMESVLRVGRDAFLFGDAVLALHDLALVNPRRIHVGTPRRVRKALPNSVEVVVAKIPPSDLTAYNGVPSTTVARALLDCRPIVMGERLIAATHDAAARGLLDPSEVERVLNALDSYP